MTSPETQTLRRCASGRVFLPFSVVCTQLNRHLLVSTPSFLHDGHFPGTVRNSMFSPIGLLWCKKKKKKKEPGRPAAPRKTNTPIQTTLRDRQSKFFDAQLIPPDERVISLQECRRTRVIFYSERRLRSTQDALWLRHNRALHCCNHVYVL